MGWYYTACKKPFSKNEFLVSNIKGEIEITFLRYLHNYIKSTMWYKTLCISRHTKNINFLSFASAPCCGLLAHALALALAKEHWIKNDINNLIVRCANKGPERPILTFTADVQKWGLLLWNRKLPWRKLVTIFVSRFSTIQTKLYEPEKGLLHHIHAARCHPAAI